MNCLLKSHSRQPDFEETQPWESSPTSIVPADLGGTKNFEATQTEPEPPSSTGEQTGDIEMQLEELIDQIEAPEWMCYIDMYVYTSIDHAETEPKFSYTCIRVVCANIYIYIYRTHM